MRPTSTQSEKLVRLNFKKFCEEYLCENIVIDESITDSPDLVFSRNNGDRVGVEITLLGYEKFMKWLSKGTSPSKRREAKIVVDLDKQLSVSVKKKNKKHLSYRTNRKLKEVWLCFHNDLYEFKVKDENGINQRERFISDAWYNLKKHRCKFKRAFFFSENTKEFIEIYNRHDITFRPQPYDKLPVITLIYATVIAGKDGWSVDVKDSEALQDKQEFN
jgi:hypothetical protein